MGAASRAGGGAGGGAGARPGGAAEAATCGGLDLHGDRRRGTGGRHGADIASQRIDALDLTCLRDIVGRKLDEGVAIDFGCGEGYQGLRMAALGQPTILVDPRDISRRIARLRAAFPALPVTFHAARVEDFLAEYSERNVSIIFSQRTIHYLAFDEAVRTLRAARNLMTRNSRMYLSASGLDSELGIAYPDATKTIGERFALLEPGMAEKHAIAEKVCLYDNADIRLLGRLSGLAPERVWKSEFGNVKAVFRPA